MKNFIVPINKKTLSDNIAQRIKDFIVAHGYQVGDRLPTTAELAKSFGVGQPTIREAFKRLQAVGAVTVRHGSGIFVGDQINSLFLPNPIMSDEPPTKKLLLDLIEARIPIEIQAIALAVKNASVENLARMEELLKKAEEYMNDDDKLNKINISFHKEISLASGNYVLYQILSVLNNLFIEEQRLLIDIYMSKKDDHRQHVSILNVLKKRNKKKATELMRAHLESVRQAILKWNPEEVSLKSNSGF